MKYRKDKNGVEISQLGYGCMRFTKKGGSIDYERAEQEVMYAIEHGVNYLDTAYLYSGSEECLGKILANNNVRDKVMIATKLPQYLMHSNAQIEKTFNEELKRLQTDHIDYYLMHMFTEITEWENLKSLGIEDWIAKHKADGSIKNIGFSYHGDSAMFIRILEAYDWDFCQIQYNYLDENTQAGRVGLETAEKMGIPVIIMEPLRGGKLVNLPDDAQEVMKKARPDYTPAEWGLRWLWNQPGVTCVLSGMNSMEMVKENVRIASEAEIGSFTDDDFSVIADVKKIIHAKEKVGCTGCRYCMPCPKGVDIPTIFYYYNMMYMDKKMPARFNYAQVIGTRNEPGFATQCVECGKCEQHCPQHINIREMLKEADKDLRPVAFKVGTSIAKQFMTKKG